MISENDYAYYAAILDDWLSLCQCRANNRWYGRVYKKQRPYKIYVEDELPEFDIEPQINAFSFYDKQIDRIFIMRNLVNFLAVILDDLAETQSQYTWMFHVVLFFCGFHEFGHLYLGHCQLIPTCRLAMTFTDNLHDGISIKDIQAMEFDADMYATAELADFVRMQMSKHFIRTWGYSDAQKMYSDAVKAICCFFSIIKWNEYKEQKKRSYGNAKPYDHPSFLLRQYLVGSLFMTWMDKYGFGRKDKEMRYYMVNNDTVFAKAPHDERIIKYEYSSVLDGTIKQHAAHVIDYCNQVLKKKTAPFTRLKTFGTLTVKFKT